MTFASIEFLFYFFPLFLALYFSAKTITTRNYIFLAFSVVFYAAGYTPHIIVLFFSVAVNFFLAQMIDRREGAERKKMLVVAVTFNIGLLGIFKYTGFLVQNLNVLLEPTGFSFQVPAIGLPLGISFYSFHAISYIADIYKRKVRANKDPAQFALYMCMFPQLVAGPIVRYNTVARQLSKRRTTWGRFSAGARLFAIGLAWKVLIADELARLVDGIFDTTTNPTFVEAWLGVFAYTIQLYYDFAGYSTMAVGLGVMVGFVLPRNFRVPLTSKSITEFWRRWHMSLSTFLRDYLYIPLGGSRKGETRTYINLWIVFLLCGLWHGASWNFVLWGGYHGMFLAMERAGLGRVLERLPGGLAQIYAMGVLMVGWCLFRTNSLPEAVEMFQGLIGLNGFYRPSMALSFGLTPLAIVAMIVGSAIGFWQWKRWPILSGEGRFAMVADYVFIGVLMVMSVIWIGGATSTPFLYYRF